MLVRIRIRNRNEPSTFPELKQQLTDRHGSLDNAAKHYGLPTSGLYRVFANQAVPLTVATALQNDYNLKRLASICECGQLFFLTRTTKPGLCHTCSMEELNNR